uniref:Secreted protein n=1 Tax=Anguilla anguilla TaxID=7936 RepID=A0A0E9TM91_ANGAN
MWTDSSPLSSSSFCLILCCSVSSGSVLSPTDSCLHHTAAQRCSELQLPYCFADTLNSTKLFVHRHVVHKQRQMIPNDC